MASASSTSPSLLEDEIRDEELQTQTKPQQPSPAPPPAKKRRNQPGNPNPDAEVIALSPRTLMATNRFVCEVCGKGFQREQNLQLHRRGHNLPWKLRLKNPKDAVRRRVYLCPEPSCVHHDPARPLGDLTGIKKHFCRKHGEKKWKCDKCAKRYAVASDLKAHAKTCGTREYRCDCGTLFSRRDSFTTHRAFCDALAQESSRLPTAGNLAALGSQLYGSNSTSLSLSQVNAQLTSLQSRSLRPGGGGGSSHFEQLMTSLTQPSPFRPPPSAPGGGFFLGNGASSVQQGYSGGEHQPLMLQSKPFHSLMQLPDLHGNADGASSNLFNLGYLSGTNYGGGGTNQLLIGDDEPTTTLFSGALMSDQMTSLYGAAESVLPRMSATALLQKASQMGSSTTTTTTNDGGEHSLQAQIDNETNLQNYAAACGLFAGASRGFGSSFGGAGLQSLEETKFDLAGVAAAGDDRLTRDFLGVGGMVRGIRSQVAVPDHGIDMSVLDPK